MKNINNSIADVGISYRNLEQQTSKTKADLDKNTVCLNA